MITSFEKVTGITLKWRFGPRRPGDVVAVYADNAKARQQLGWETRFTLDDMMRTAWAWEQKLAEENL